MRSMIRGCCVILFAVTVFSGKTNSAAESRNEAAEAATRQPIRRGVTYLLEAQADDGAWRSRTYGSLKDGRALTPLVLRALMIAGQTTANAAVARAAKFTAGLAPDLEHSGDPNGLYLAANAAIVLSRPEFSNYKRERDLFVDYLRRRQLVEALNWSKADYEYGGWGYAPVPIRKTGAPTAPQSNISATRFAIEALKAAGVQGPVTFADALHFVERCQNFRATQPTPFDDGGFFFIQRDSTRNKAGFAGIDEEKKERRFHSYGSATADGLGTMLLCGRSMNDARCKAALQWLLVHASVGTHPGKFEPRREVARNAAYFYYCWSLMHTCQLMRKFNDHAACGFEPSVIRDLRSRQHADGAWSNEVVDLREDDPLIATSFAVAALCETE